MRARALMAVAAVLLGAPAAAGAQATTPTPTATPAQAAPTATPFPPTSARGKAVQRVYDDYRRDGVIEPCRHTQRALEDTRDTIQPSFDQDYPDFRAAVEAGIGRHERGRCEDSATPGSASPTPTATAVPTVTATPTAAPSSAPQSGLLPGGGGGSGSDSGSGSDTGDDDAGATPPAGASPTPTPTATAFPTATPTPAPPRTVVEPAANATALTLPRILLGVALIGGALLALSALLASRGGRLAGLRHAWREAGLRTRATWSDFADWLRLGR